jgi:hypothetical protein
MKKRNVVFSYQIILESINKAMSLDFSLEQRKRYYLI